MSRAGAVDWPGGCWCGAVRFRVTARPVFRAQCHCRACQYHTGGAPNHFVVIPPEGFRWEGEAPAAFRRGEAGRSVTRRFCAACGTHLTSERPDLDAVVLKVGTLDDPSHYPGPAAAIFCAEMAPFHTVPEGVPAFDGLPPERG